MPELSRDLCELLDSDGSPDEAAREIGRYLAIREECRQALPALKAIAEHKAGAEGVKRVISRRFPTFPPPQRSDEEWEAWWSDYYDTLSDVPLACLEAAMRAWVARPDSQFMPKPGELRDLAYRTPSKTLRRYQRARRAIQLADQPEAPVSLAAPEGVAVDGPALVKQMLDEYRQKTAAAQKIPELPSIAGKADEGGVTPQMRALLARQRGEDLAAE